jgi:two-component system, OmpR family, response regulator QseB
VSAPTGSTPRGEPAERPALLVVEDDPDLRSVLVRLFEAHGYAVLPAPDAQSGLHLALTRHLGVLVVDRRLPDGDGADLVARLRERGVATPALLLTASGSVQDRVGGLDSGADDYVVKPFDTSELLARVHGLLRRNPDDPDALPLGAARLHVQRMQAELADGTLVALTPAETTLLAQLARRPSRVFSRDELREALSAEPTGPSLVDTYVYALRQKLGPDVVRTVRGVGYRAGALP